MNQILQSDKYNALIKKIKQKRKIVIVLTIIAMLITIAACSPFHIEVLDKTIVDYKGANPVITVLLILLILFFELIAYTLVSTPLSTSMDIECDPEKHLILNTALSKPNNLDPIYAADFIYMGKFEEALLYANKMVACKAPATMIIGLFNKARCEFFLGEISALKETVKQYENALLNMKKSNKKAMEAYKKIQQNINLLVAISEEDKEKIADLCNIQAWNNSKAGEGYINYIKGISAYMLGDKEGAIYRFMCVKENCRKTAFLNMAEQYLSALSSDI